METIIKDLQIIKENNANNLISSYLIGSYLNDSSSSNDIDIVLFVKNKDSFYLSPDISYPIGRVQYDQYKKRFNFRKAMNYDLLIVDNIADLEYILAFNQSRIKQLN